MTTSANNALRDSLNSNVASRVAYETEKSAHSCAAKFARYFAFDFKSSECAVSEAMIDAAIASNVASFDFLNDAKRTNARFNVYAAEKVRKTLRAIASNVLTLCDKYTVATVTTLMHNRENEAFFLSRKDCYALVCKDVETEIKKSAMKNRCAVSMNTATTQISSTLRALDALNVLSFDAETKRVSNINFDHAVFAMIK